MSYKKIDYIQDLNLESFEVTVVYTDGTEERKSLTTTPWFDEFEAGIDIDFSQLDNDLSSKIKEELETIQEIDSSDRAQRRAESGYCQ